jgi:hypothetical protein
MACSVLNRLSNTDRCAAVPTAPEFGGKPNSTMPTLRSAFCLAPVQRQPQHLVGQRADTLGAGCHRPVRRCPLARRLAPGAAAIAMPAGEHGRVGRAVDFGQARSAWWFRPGQARRTIATTAAASGTPAGARQRTAGRGPAARQPRQHCRCRQARRSARTRSAKPACQCTACRWP